MDKSENEYSNTSNARILQRTTQVYVSRKRANFKKSFYTARTIAELLGLKLTANVSEKIPIE